MPPNLHVPVRVRVVGVPDEETLELLTRRVTALVAARLAAARRELGTGHPGGRPRETHELYDPSRDTGSGYELPSYQGGGKPTQVPVRGHRPWTVLRAVHFRTTVGAFLDAVERQRDEPLTARALYDEQAAEERWVALWLVQVNDTTSLTDLEPILYARAAELSRLGPREILTSLISPFDNAWQDLVRLDRTGQVRALIPSPGVRDQRRVEGNGQDAVVSHGGWVLFAFMRLPGISVEEVLDVGALTQVLVPVPDAARLVDQEHFAHRWGVAWNRFAEEFATEHVTVRMLGARLRKRVLAQAAYYLITIAADEQASTAASAHDQQELLGEGMVVLTPELLSALPSPVAAHARSVASPPAPTGIRAGPDVGLLPGWPVLLVHAEIALGPDRLAAALQGPLARRIADDLRRLMRAGTGLDHWVFKVWALLDEANAGGPPQTRPPGGTLVEHMLGDLDRTGDFVPFYDQTDETGHFGLRAWLLAISLPTRFADHPRVRRLHEELTAARVGTMRNLYLPDDTGGAVLMGRASNRTWAIGTVLGDLDDTYLVSRDAQRIKDARLTALKEALVRHRAAILAEAATGKLPKDMDEEGFAREALARALKDVPIGKQDIEDVTIERSMKLLSVRRRDIQGLPSYDIRLVFVERTEGGRWRPVGDEVSETSGDFEARLIWWELGRAGEFYETFGLAVTVVGVVLVAWEAGLLALLVEAAGGATALAVSITLSELVWLLKVAFTDEKFTLRGFFMAALDGYLMALGFRFGGLLGRWGAEKIGTATLRRVVSGWIAERLVAGVAGGAMTAALERFADDVLRVATGEGSWSGIGDYVRAMAFGAAVGVVGEFALQPALHSLLAGGRTALESTAELVARIRAEGWSAVQFSAGVTEALANLRAGLTTLAGDAAARGFSTALADRLGPVIRELGSGAVAVRVLELSGARLTPTATEGLQRFLKAAQVSASPTRSLELVRIFAQHPQETVHFLEALATLETDAARHLVSGTFGSTQELAALLGRISHYEPAQQRAVVRLLGELGIVAAEPAGTLTTEQVLNRQLAASLRVQAAGQAAEGSRLRTLATRAREQADRAATSGNARRAAAKRAEADKLERRADIAESAGEQARAQAEQLPAGAGPKPADVVPTDPELDAAFAALESGTSATGGPQAWVRLPVRAVRGNAPVLERLVRPLFRSLSGNRVVFRVEGGSGTAQSRSFVNIDQAGNVRLATGGKALNLNFGVFERAVEFLLENRSGARLKVFEVEENWFQAMRGVSTPEQGKAARFVVTEPVTGARTPLHGPGQAPGISDVPGLPRIVDTRYGVDQLQVPAELLPELQEFIVPNTGRVLEFTP
ncbi:hypothetical protein ACFQ6S_07320 [Streptomyces sp. NPDC056479]|uniref:hypothetical protein n=1 Tax=Streptomyces sp. NPDC056479 TaxID=3345832 RepID=UPI003698B289